MTGLSEIVVVERVDERIGILVGGRHAHRAAVDHVGHDAHAERVVEVEIGVVVLKYRVKDDLVVRGGGGGRRRRERRRAAGHHHHHRRGLVVVVVVVDAAAAVVGECERLSGRCSCESVHTVGQEGGGGRGGRRRAD